MACRPTARCRRSSLRTIGSAASRHLAGAPPPPPPIPSWPSACCIAIGESCPFAHLHSPSAHRSLRPDWADAACRPSLAALLPGPRLGDHLFRLEDLSAKHAHMPASDPWPGGTWLPNRCRWRLENCWLGLWRAPPFPEVLANLGHVRAARDVLDTLVVDRSATVVPVEGSRPCRSVSLHVDRSPPRPADTRWTKAAPRRSATRFSGGTTISSRSSE